MEEPAATVTATIARDSSATPESRRERKKRQTREAMIDVALDLFVRRGYEATTIRAITDAVDVAERTFFRYFSSKEDLVISVVQQDIERMIEALRRRPAEEAPVIALRNAFHDSFDAHVSELRRYLEVIKAVGSAPELTVALFGWAFETSEPIAAVFAEREGVELAADPRPRLLVGMFWSVLAVVVLGLGFSPQPDVDNDLKTVLTAFDRDIAQLAPTMSGHWRTAA
jgi:AcrR family transcriptional regulator